MEEQLFPLRQVKLVMLLHFQFAEQAAKQYQKAKLNEIYPLCMSYTFININF